MQATTGKRLAFLGFSLSSATAAFLLFQIEPVIGKIVTPVYGGTASVWTICLLFFQTVVLAGYTLTCILSRLSPRTQSIIYGCMFALSILAARIPPTSAWTANNNPVLGLLVALTEYAAVPCILLSTVSGMTQLWFAAARLGNPYPLYSISNLGSMAALLTYPILFEPNFTIAATLNLWTAIYDVLLVFVIIISIFVWRSTGGVSVSGVAKSTADNSISRLKFIWWTFLAAMGSIILMSYTGYITSDISPMPLLWVAPLSLYLLSFVLVFGNSQLYFRRLFLASWMWIAAAEPLAVSCSFTLGLIVNLVIVFMLCMICHGELASEKPKPANLPLFYLALSLGGAVGGIFVGVIAPAIFNFDAERLVALAVMGLLTLDKLFLPRLPSRKMASTLRIGLVSLVGVFIVACVCIPPANLVTRERNFYGSTRVTQEGYTRIMYRGRIIQGQEYNRNDLCAWQVDPYVHPVQIIMDFLRVQRGGPIQCAVIGLGTGSYASQGAPGDAITYYELDPKIIQMADQNFDYLKRTPARVIVNAGDGRKLLSADPKRDYDAIVVDAFNGDSIPCHLLTLESAKMYLQHLKPSGSLVFHVSNRYVDLPPLLAKLGDTLGMHYCRIRYMGGVSFVIMNKDQTLLADMQNFDKKHAAKYDHIEVEPIAARENLRVWTDDFINLSGILKL